MVDFHTARGGDPVQTNVEGAGAGEPNGSRVPRLLLDARRGISQHAYRDGRDSRVSPRRASRHLSARVEGVPRRVAHVSHILDAVASRAEPVVEAHAFEGSGLVEPADDACPMLPRDSLASKNELRCVTHEVSTFGAPHVPAADIFVEIPSCAESNVRVNKPETRRARRQALSRRVEAARMINNTSRLAWRMVDYRTAANG